MSKRVIIINQNTGYLTIDVANAFASQCEKTVLMAGIVKPMERQLNPLVRVRKIIRYNRTSVINRIFTWGIGSIQVFFLLLFRYRKYEVIYFTNPPMAYLASLLLRNKFSLVVYDTYPDALKNIGIHETHFIYRTWSNWNKKLFAKAEKLITLSNGMAEQLSHYIDRQKIKVIPNWPGSEQFKPVRKEDNPFIREHQLEGKFVVLYSGNMGLTHSLECLIEVAAKLRAKDHITFLFIGEGEKKEILQKQAEKYMLTNCRFLTWQPAAVLPHSLAAADLAVIALTDESARLSVPSKTYNLLATGAPLLCITPEDSELYALIAKYRNGICFEKDKIDEIASFIISLSGNNERQLELSSASLKAAEDFHYSNAMNYL